MPRRAVPGMIGEGARGGRDDRGVHRGQPDAGSLLAICHPLLRGRGGPFADRDRRRAEDGAGSFAGAPRVSSRSGPLRTTPRRERPGRVTMIVLTQNIWGGAPSWTGRRGALARRIAA